MKKHVEKDAKKKNVKIRGADMMDRWVPSRDQVFMNIAAEISRLSKDPKTKVGAIIVSKHDNRILGLGYNGLLDEVRDSDRVWSWKHSHVIHAEINAIKNANHGELYGCKIYTTLYPCLNCAKTILRWGIEEIIFRDYREEFNTECEGLLQEMSGMVTIRKFPEG